MNIRILVDSTFNLEKDFVLENNISVIPLNVIIDGKSYRDGVDIRFIEVLYAVEKGSKVSTSQPSPNVFLEFFENLKNEGATDIVCLTISSTLSGTYQAANIAKQDIEGVNIHIIDTLSTAIGAETITEIFVRYLNEGDSLDTAIEKITEVTHNSGILMSMDNLNSLQKSGRITRIKATIGNLLRVKPIIEFFNGDVNINSKMRTEKQVAEGIVDKMKDFFEGVDTKIHISVAYVHFKDRITQVLKRIQEEFPNVKVKVRDGITPVIAINLGYGGFGVSFSFE